MSAYELQALPLPSPDNIRGIEKLVETRAHREDLEQAVIRVLEFSAHSAAAL